MTPFDYHVLEVFDCLSTSRRKEHKNPLRTPQENLPERSSEEPKEEHLRIKSSVLIRVWSILNPDSSEDMT